MPSESVVEQVREKYGAVARSGLTGDQAGVRAVAEAFGYSPEELASIPAGANMGLGCGNPTATARLRPGEVVVDLGSGGGLDVFLAAKKVGPTGKAIGIDMTPEMVERAKANAAKQGLTNVEFHLATIDKLPLPDPAVFREIFRILKPGGRVAVSDIALKKPLPPEVGSDLLAYVGCVAGAVLIEDYIRDLTAVGFSAAQVVDTNKDLNAYAQVEGQSGCCAPLTEAPVASDCCTPAPEGSSACCTPKADAKPMAEGCCTPAPSGSSACCTMSAPADARAVHGGLAELLTKYNVNEFAASVQVYAVKGN
jgi:arsenite methyltransferase